MAELSTQRVSNLREYLAYRTAEEETYRRRRDFERSLIRDGAFTVKGYCYPCQRRVDFRVDFLHAFRDGDERAPNWRERLLCPRCGLSNRMRAAVQLIERYFARQVSGKFYLTEATTPLYRLLARRYPNLIASESLGDSIPSGAVNDAGWRNEDVTRLTFRDEEIDLVASFDVFEHVPDYVKALEECHRVIKPGGGLLFTVPFRAGSQKNVVRAVLRADGTIEHVLPPQYHGDLVNPEGSLAFYEFGWEILDQLRAIGFSEVWAHVYWSAELGYLGEEQIAFVAHRRGRMTRAA